MTIALRQMPLTQVVNSIVKANNGLLFDPSDMSTLYQDAAGTVPVTAVEQPVGKILDKSGNGYHATQSITASRPVLSARYNLLTYTEDLTNAIWNTTEFKVNVGSNVVNNSIGQMTADKISATSDSTAHLVIQNISITSGNTYTFYSEFKAAEYSCVQLSTSTGFDNNYLNFDLQNGVVGAGKLTGGIIPLGDGWFGCYVTATATSTQVAGRILISLIPSLSSARNPVWVGNGTSGIYCSRTSLTISNTVTRYQRVNTATDYDTDERYFKKYLQFSSAVAIDDFLNLPYMGLYSGGAASIIAARDAASQATDTYIISERSTTNANPKYCPSRQLASGGNMDSYISDDTAAVVLDTTGSAFSGASDKVIRSVVDAGNNIKLFKNGALAANDNYTRSGTLTLNTTTIGASVSTTTSNYASMKLYGLIITKSALTDAQRVRCERFLAQKSGVML